MKIKRLKPLIIFSIVFLVFGLLTACNIFVRLNTTRLPVPNPITTSYKITEVHASGGGAGASGASFALTEDGVLLAWGSFGGTLEGVEVEWPVYRPTKVMDDVIAVSPVMTLRMVITSDGALWGLYGDVHEHRRSIQIKLLEDVVYVSAANDRTMAITSDGTLWGWGSNREGRLGDGTTEDRNYPVKVMEDVIAVSVSRDLTMAITSDNALWVWGRNVVRLEDGTSKDSHTPIRAMDDVIAVFAYGVVITSDNVLRRWPDGATIIEDVVTASVDRRTFMAVTSDGTLWGWGRNETGALGDGTQRERREPIKIMENVVSVSTSGFHTLAVTSDGNLWAWGENSLGQLGIGTNRGQFETTRGILETFWFSPILVMEYIPEE